MRTLLFSLRIFILLLIGILAGILAAGCASAPGHLRTNTAVIEDYSGPEAVRNGVVFVYASERPAKKVFLAGSFNTWRPQDRKFELRENRPGIWSVTIPLDPGLYQYKFIVDGSWIADPANPNTRPDGFGGSYSLVEVR
jgi:hypothetical protein